MRKGIFGIPVLLALFLFMPAAGHAQVSVGIGIGAAPVCPYGYYDYAPYACAPYGYYGPEWFNGGVFIGAGPWFRGPRNFYGHVDNRYDPHFGWHGNAPAHDEHWHAYGNGEFHGNEYRNGRGDYRSEGEHNEFHGGGGHR